MCFTIEAFKLAILAIILVFFSYILASSFFQELLLRFYTVLKQ